MTLVSTEAAISRAEHRLGRARMSSGYLRFAACPGCGGTGSRSFWVSDDGGFARAGCFRCGLRTGDALGLLGLLDGRDHSPPPNWTPIPKPTDAERAAKARSVLDLSLHSPRIESALAHAERVLLWNAETMRSLRTGELDGRIVLSVWGDDGDLLGVTAYAMPGTPLRERAEASGWPKLIAYGPRSLWPRPCDVREGAHLPGWLVLTEGASAAATASGCGFACSAFPSSAGISEYDAQRVARRSSRVVVVGDCDQPGRAGMDVTVLRLRSAGVEAVGVDLDPGREDGFDAGDFLREIEDEPLAAGARLADEIGGTL